MPKKLLLATLFLVLFFPNVPSATVEGSKSSQGKFDALPDAYLVTLALKLDGETREFSIATASRHFTVSPPDLRLDFRGRLWRQAEGRELLDFTAELQHRIPGEENHTRVGSYSGSTYIQPGKRTEIAKSPYSTLSVVIKKL